MRKIDYHMHTCFSADSDASPEEHILKAIDMGLEEICFTDHHDVEFPIEPFILDVQSYTKELQRLQQKYKNQITIKIGIELGLDPMYKDEINRVAASYPFDFVIGSIHAVGLTEFIEAKFFEGKTKEQAHRDYFNQCLACIETFDCFNVFGHIDYIERYGIYEDNTVQTELYLDIIDQCLKTLISKNKGLEVNTSGYKLRNEGFPKRQILQRYYDLGGRIITIGTDSHDSSRVGENVESVMKILSEIGFEDVTTFTKQQPDIRI